LNDFKSIISIKKLKIVLIIRYYCYKKTIVMAKRNDSKGSEKILETYTHTKEKCTNLPPMGLVKPENDPLEAPKKRFSYDCIFLLRGTELNAAEQYPSTLGHSFFFLNQFLISSKVERKLDVFVLESIKPLDLFKIKRFCF
jgi:hypothetical protein